jgi:hypothetical protein
MDREQSF